MKLNDKGIIFNLSSWLLPLLLYSEWRVLIMICFVCLHIPRVNPGSGNIWWLLVIYVGTCSVLLTTLLLSLIAHQARSIWIKMAINNGPWDSVCLFSAVFDGHVLYLIECLLARFAVEKPTYTQAWSQWIATYAFIVQHHQRIHCLSSVKELLSLCCNTCCQSLWSYSRWLL